ncbi:transcription factor Tfb2-domain-containing protein [Endogone sp. FLAS-F59071]|nr:transcription factor Tfb2-domain-containing protein [Endogone sp. FLAS-F59071]|eukprot:RUS19904.1 transcription factor Tfb2-domain-containing protein [Endogone sp. FLAS-F59071]
MLEDLRDFGIVYQRKKGSRRYYPTRLATTLTSGTTALTVSGSDSSIGAGSKRRRGSVVGPGADDQENETGFVILETNYRLYAYTDSPLQIAVLNLFVHLKARFVNMVSGVITRDSVRKALTNGITADQIPLLPLTVVDQIRLWEMERNRLKHVQGSLYEGFAMQADFDATQKYAADIGALVWHNKKARMLFVTAADKDKVSAYVKKLLARLKS